MEAFDVELNGVARIYRSETEQSAAALQDITFSVPALQVVAITGPSGSGKSTLLHVLGAMDRADNGRVRVGPHPVSELSRRDQAHYRSRIGFVFQRFHLLTALSVLDNVIAPLFPRKTSFDRTKRARELLERVGLASKEAELPSRLSGGEQQRVAIARALINDPGLLLADEPTGNLDSNTSLEIMRMLLTLRDEVGVTVLIATHDPLIATRCDRVLRLQDGRIIEDLIVHP